MADEDYDDGTEDGGPQTPQEFAALRRANRATREAEERAARAERSVAFLRAGIDPESKGLASYFVKGYDGDLEPEKIKAAAIEAGVMQPPAPDADQQAQQQALQQNAATQQKIAGAAVQGDAVPTPEAQFANGVREALNAGGVDGLAAYLETQGIPQVEF